MRATCPVCGWPELPSESPPEPEPYAICPCCGTCFGDDDFRAAYDHGLETFAEGWPILRARWIRAGYPWWSKQAAPPGWDPQAQLAALDHPPAD